jgi:hypothetical protein
MARRFIHVSSLEFSVATRYGSGIIFAMMDYRRVLFKVKAAWLSSMPGLDRGWAARSLTRAVR